MGRKWSLASKVFLVLGMCFGLASYLIVDGYVERVRASAPDLGPPADAVVARVAVARGQTLTQDVLEVVSMPSAYVPSSALSGVDRAVGRIVLAGLEPGEVVTSSRLAPDGASQVSSLVPQGFRAFAMTPSLPSGSIHPGDRVDVLATFAGRRPHTETVATDLEVLLVVGGAATGASAQSLLDVGAPSSSGGETLMLLVLPYEAEQLAFARAFADLTVSIAGAEEPSSE